MVVGGDAFGPVSVAAVAVVGATFGPFVLFAPVRQADLPIEPLADPTDPIDGSRLFRWLDRWGMRAVVLPIARGSLTVPAAMSDGSALRFSASLLLGTSIYTVGLLTIAVGVDALAELV